ncbi:two-component system histidine kinase PnpS [Haloimpatiens lingqiaonensis]|uniref:two-component system histidine kinase PnpS n=1 Tax=Haloimpatiens lingqiaonensis TaxID=1380675 RepID=UPI0010FDEE03|nr:sensor histidine kinase [Haloimpatiens lingqiaonensis]
MKKKMMLYLCASIVTTLIVVTMLFMSIANLQYETNIRKQLNSNNLMIKNLIETNNVRDQRTFFQETFKDTHNRITYIDAQGNIIYDSKVTEKLENHKERKEVKSAMEKGQGSDLRISNTTKEKTLYVATKLKNGNIIRSAMSFQVIQEFDENYLNYYFLILVLVFLVVIVFANRLSYIIIKPVKDLEITTSRIAKGELDRRVNANSKDEIGQLGKSFNKMADKLQETINDSVDKQTRLEAILKSMDSGVIAIDRTFKIIMINPYAEKIFGVSGNVVGKNILEGIKNNHIEKIFKSSNDDYFEIKTICPCERILRIKTADVVNRNEYIGKVAVLQDITDIKKLENVRSEFVANVSHELKTPLTSIKGFAETLKEVEDSDTREKFLNIINDEAERLTRLISDIMALSDIEKAREVTKEPMDVNKIIMDIYNLMKNTAKDKGIEIYIEGEKIPIIYGNVDKFKQMIINLVDNSIKYSEKGGKVYIITEKGKYNIKICVKDTGVGISQEHIPRLFERFYRVDKARSRSAGGTGLGLAIVKHIVLSMNGNIDVESVVGKGSKFTVTLPYNHNDK